jgi:hemerythrin
MDHNRDFIEWNCDFELGIPELDAQHKTLVDLANRLHAEIMKGSGRDEARRAISELFAYSATHFSDEEAYFQRFNFPSLERHSGEHASFTAQALDFEQRLASGDPAKADEILLFLKSWIRIHIQNDDRELVRIARKAGVCR